MSAQNGEFRGDQLDRAGAGSWQIADRYTMCELVWDQLGKVLKKTRPTSTPASGAAAGLPEDEYVVGTLWFGEAAAQPDAPTKRLSMEEVLIRHD